MVSDIVTVSDSTKRIPPIKLSNIWASAVNDKTKTNDQSPAKKENGDLVSEEKSSDSEMCFKRYG